LRRRPLAYTGLCRVNLTWSKCLQKILVVSLCSTLLRGDLLYDIEEVVKPIVGALIAREGARKTLVGEVVTAAYSTGNIVPWYKINPWECLRLANGVLDLEALRVVDSVDYYFTYRLPVKIRQEEIDLISAIAIISRRTLCTSTGGVDLTRRTGSTW